MKKLVLLVVLLSAVIARCQQSGPSTMLYFAVLDKGPTTPPWHFVVDDQWTGKVHKKRWTAVSVQPGPHKVNFGGKVGNRDKHHKIDLEVSVETGQSRYFLVEMKVNLLNPTTLSGTSFEFSEVSQENWKYRMQDAKSEDDAK